MNILTIFDVKKNISKKGFEQSFSLNVYYLRDGQVWSRQNIIYYSRKENYQDFILTYSKDSGNFEETKQTNLEIWKFFQFF